MTAFITYCHRFVVHAVVRVVVIAVIVVVATATISVFVSTIIPPPSIILKLLRDKIIATPIAAECVNGTSIDVIL